eukprot:scaffold2327_cov96-Cylindrotheca_fusiformis.AAC.2
MGVVFFMAACGRAEWGRFEFPFVLPLHQRQYVVNPSDTKMSEISWSQVAGEPVPVDLGAEREVPVVCLAEAFQLSFVIGVGEVGATV